MRLFIIGFAIGWTLIWCLPIPEYEVPPYMGIHCYFECALV